MVGPKDFKIIAPEGDYYVTFQIDMYSLSFPIVCHPDSLKREILKFVEANSEKKDQMVNVMLIEKNEAVNTHDVLPLLATINFIPKGEIMPEDEEQDEAKRIFQFHQFIDQLCASGELDYLHDGEE